MKIHRIRAAVAAAIASMTLVACSESNDAEREAPWEVAGEAAQITASPAAAIETTDNSQGATAGGDGSPIRLSPLGAMRSRTLISAASWPAASGTAKARCC